MTGDLEINSGNYSRLFFESFLGDGVSFLEGSHRKLSLQSSQAGIVNQAYLNNRRYFDINNKEEEDSIVNALTLADVIDGVKTEYIVLHTGNISSQLDNRYVNISGDTMTGPLYLKTGSHYGQIQIIPPTGGNRLIGSTASEINLQIINDDNITKRTLALYKAESYDIKNCLQLWDTTTDKNNNYIILHTGNFSDKLDSRYVNVTGDIMTGKLTIKPSTNWAQYAFYSTSGYYRAIEGDDSRLRLDARDTVNTSDRRYIDLYTNTGQSNIAHALYLVQTVGGTTTTYPILHSGNYLNYPNKYITWFGDYKNEVASGTTGNNPYEGTALGSTKGFYVTGVYNTSNVPTTYGNMLNIIGRGTGQLLCEWTGTDNKRGRIFYRCHRDTAGGGWSDWHQVWQEGESITSAVWNDYAECREADTIEPGYVLIEVGDDTLTKSTERLQPYAGVSSDTWGFSQGETDRAKTPIAVAGRVLVYPFQERENYKPGQCVCAAPGGTVDIMTEEEIIRHPDRIVGTVSCVPTYDTWGGGPNADRPEVTVNGRIWIKVK